MPGTHAKFSASAASRWLNCPGSTALLETVNPSPSSKYAAEGTLAHEFAAWFLTQGERFVADYIGATADAKVDAKPLTEEMAAAIQVYLDAVWAECDKSPDHHLYVEKTFVLKVDSAEDGAAGGTSDAIVYHPTTKRLVVFDYKHGQGVSVSAEDNDQLKFYAAGAAFSNDWPLAEVELVIVQPRARDVDEAGAIKRVSFDVMDLLEFKDRCDQAIGVALHGTRADPLPPFQVGPWCRWCDAATVCPAKQQEVLSALTIDIPIEDAPLSNLLVDGVSEFAPERLSRIVAGLHVLTAWANQVQEYLEGQLLSGVKVPGWKVVNKIGRAKWISDEQSVFDDLDVTYGLDEDLVRPRKLVTIGDVEKLMKAEGASKAEIDSFKLKHTIKDSSGLTIAQEQDRRPAVDVLETAFGDVSVEP